MLRGAALKCALSDSPEGGIAPVAVIEEGHPFNICVTLEGILAYGRYSLTDINFFDAGLVLFKGRVLCIREIGESAVVIAVNAQGAVVAEGPVQTLILSVINKSRLIIYGMKGKFFLCCACKIVCCHSGGKCARINCSGDND